MCEDEIYCRPKNVLNIVYYSEILFLKKRCTDVHSCNCSSQIAFPEYQILQEALHIKHFLTFVLIIIIKFYSALHGWGQTRQLSRILAAEEKGGAVNLSVHGHISLSPRPWIVNRYITLIKHCKELTQIVQGLLLYRSAINTLQAACLSLLS